MDDIEEVVRCAKFAFLSFGFSLFGFESVRASSKFYFFLTSSTSYILDGNLPRVDGTRSTFILVKGFWTRVLVFKPRRENREKFESPPEPCGLELHSLRITSLRSLTVSL
jgi:hypothetical protein